MNQCTCSIDPKDLAGAIADGIRKALQTPAQEDAAGCCETETACCSTDSGGAPSTVVVVCGCSKP